MLINLNQDSRQHKPAIEHSYNQYFASGLYDARYPEPNRNVLEFVLKTLQLLGSADPPSGTAVQLSFLDFGCGNGRYLLPILQHSNWQAIAYDISNQAVSQLKGRLEQQQLSSRCHIVQQWPQAENYHVALLLYGVLGHIKTSRQRIALLKEVRQHLISTLIVSVPNIQRRFLFGKVFSPKKSDIEYRRRYNNRNMYFHYHLYCLDGIKQELAQAGFKISSVQAESILPEKWITNSTLCRVMDALLCKLIPLHWAYGFLVSARRD